MLTVMMESARSGIGTGPDLSVLGRVLSKVLSATLRCWITLKGCVGAGCRCGRQAASSTPVGICPAVLSEVRGEWLMLLEPGARPQIGWIDEIAEHISMVRHAARFTPSRNYRRPLFQRLTKREAPLAHGLLLQKSVALGRVPALQTARRSCAGGTAAHSDFGNHSRLGCCQKLIVSAFATALQVLIQSRHDSTKLQGMCDSPAALSKCHPTHPCRHR